MVKDFVTVQTGGKYMKIRRAQETDMEGMNRLLIQVLHVHHKDVQICFRAETERNIQMNSCGILYRMRKHQFWSL